MHNVFKPYENKNFIDELDKIANKIQSAIPSPIECKAVKLLIDVVYNIDYRFNVRNYTCSSYKDRLNNYNKIDIELKQVMQDYKTMTEYS